MEDNNESRNRSSILDPQSSILAFLLPRRLSASPTLFVDSLPSRGANISPEQVFDFNFIK
jgi:hypothetical protein